MAYGEIGLENSQIFAPLCVSRQQKYIYIFAPRAASTVDVSRKITYPYNLLGVPYKLNANTIQPLAVIHGNYGERHRRHGTGVRRKTRSPDRPSIIIDSFARW